MHRLNHYVPRSYLKRWAHGESKVWTYRVLVSHGHMPFWRAMSMRSVAYHEHLYTQIVASGESDEIERWLDAEFEAPAEPVIERAVADQRLSRADWKVLVRFFAAQDLRTPARLVENLKRWSATLPGLMQKSLSQSVSRLSHMSAKARDRLTAASPQRHDGPFRVSVGHDAVSSETYLEAETISGRGLWLWSMRHALTNTSRLLLQHRWTILTPPPGITWLTSDDPAIRLNFNGPTDYTFGGGWGSVGTDLLLPLGPRHMLFTQVGKQVPPRGAAFDREKSLLLQRFTAEHAHRYIFALTPDQSVQSICPRTVDAQRLRQETQDWQHWHAEQGSAERSLLNARQADAEAPDGRP